MAQGDVLAKRVARARAELGLTQEELAKRLGIARSTLAEIETGRRKLTAEELYEMADLLRRPMDYFFSTTQPAAIFALRVETEDLAEPVRAALVELDNRLADLRRLERFSGVDLRSRLGEYRLDDWRNPDLAARHIARDERQRLGAGTHPICDLRDTLEKKIGLLAFFQYVPSGGFSGAFASDGERAALLINVAHLRGRVNFTLAHEYGHSLIAERQAHVELRRRKSTPEERFADGFAANFLMPQQALEEAVEHFGIRPPHVSQDHLLVLASYFGVSFSALLGRLEHFSIVGRDVGDELRRTTKPVARTRQLGLPDPRQEYAMLPLTYQHMAFIAFHKEAVSRSRLAELLAMDVDEAQKLYRAWAMATVREGSGRGGKGVAAP